MSLVNQIKRNVSNVFVSFAHADREDDFVCRTVRPIEPSFLFGLRNGNFHAYGTKNIWSMEPFPSMYKVGFLQLSEVDQIVG